MLFMAILYQKRKRTLKEIRFDSKNLTYKNPFGALKTEQECVFSIEIHKDAAPVEVWLVYRADGTTDEVYVPMHFQGEEDAYLRFSCSVSFAQPDLYFYRFQFSAEGGVRFCGKKDGEAVIGDWLSEWQITVYDKNFKTPAWAKGAVMYQIFPDRFAKSERFSPLPAKNARKIHENWLDVPDFIYDNPNYKGNDFFCGNLDGVIEKLPYIKELGVDVIYFNPIFESPENHRYSTGDYENIDPYLGTNETFEKLCQEAEKQGIRIILDGVFSHTGADSIYFNKYHHYDSIGAWQGESSPYYHWYQFDQSKTGYACWWGFENLPNVIETSPAYLNFITGEGGVLASWQKRGASGWRLDVADELPDAFLDALRARVKQTDPDALIIGEVWEDATSKFAYGERRRYLLGKQIDSVMNYPWRTAIIEYVKTGNAALFKDRIESVLENYPEPAIWCLMNSLSTHDTARIINELGVTEEVPHRDAAGYQLSEEAYSRGKEALKRAAFLLFMLPGIPCIYYGDEVGLTGFRDPYCRMCYPYGREDEDLLSYFKTLGRLRKTYKEAFTLPLEDFQVQNGMVSFCRGDAKIVINMGECDEIVTKSAEFVTIFSRETEEKDENSILVKSGGFSLLYRKTA